VGVWGLCPHVGVSPLNPKITIMPFLAPPEKEGFNKKSKVSYGLIKPPFA